ncbi:MAG: F-type H+-transporting ATPase subunit delta [Verrucomicrobiales bacterium]|nr:F-type H+-transporting ATPase subunit delta [Verrucomicrobiales bacterium]
MKINKQARLEARRAFRACEVNGKFDDSRARQVVNILVEQKPRGYLGILTQFQKLVKLDDARRNAVIESAVPLPADYQAKVQADLVKTYGEGLNFTFKQNPALLGGLRIQVGGDVYDGSVQGRLEALQESF